MYTFDRYTLDTIGRSLSRDGTSIKLPGRLFDALLYLVEHGDRLVSQDELEQAIWPGRKMDRGNVARAISSLRTALRADGAETQMIITVPGRGYRFGARVSSTGSAPPSPAGLVPTGVAVDAPAPSTMAPGRPMLTRGRVMAAAATTLGIGILLAVGLSSPHGSGERSREAPSASIAVLPFVNTSGDPTQDYLSDGITDELINRLGSVRSLRVAARTSSFSFKGKTPAIRDVAQALSVASVLDGTVRRIGQTIIVTVELIDSATGYQLWSGRYDLDEHDLSPTERRIVEAVAATLKIVPAGGVVSVTSGGTTNAEAFDSYMRAMALIETGDNTKFEPAFRELSHALTLDPNYAMAWAQRARLLFKWQSHSTQALTDADTAVKLAPDLGFSHATLGMVLTFPLGDFARAKAECARAVDLAPNDAATLMDYGFFQVYMGDFAHGLASARQALALDPLTAMTHIRFALLSALSGRFDDADTALRRVAILRSDQQDLLRSNRALIRTWRGDAKGALEDCGQHPDWHSRVCAAIAYHRLGDQARAEEALAQARSKLGEDGAYNYATVYAAWGRREDAIHWLQRALQLQDTGLIFLRVDPLLQSIRDTPAFGQIEQALKFPPR